MRISVIITTYNNPDWLEKALWGYAAQDDRDFDVLIADDGSTESTRERIDYMRKETGLTIDHVWHEDKGFRKCMILNKAIKASSADYLLFTDGDCVPRRDFIAIHRRFARPGCFLSGGYFKLPLDVSKAISPEDIRSNCIFDTQWLIKAGIPPCWKMARFLLNEVQANIFTRLTTTLSTFNGMNSSVWRDDALQVNGFDERMEYGGLDREFGLRLVNAGIRPVNIRYYAICHHLDHGRGYKRPEILQQNRHIRRETTRTGIAWTPYGIQRDDSVHHHA